MTRSEAAVLSLRNAFIRLFALRGVHMDLGVKITNLARPHFQAGRRSAFYRGVYVQNPNGIFSMGSDSHLGAYTYVNVCRGEVRIGNGVAIGPHCSLIAYSNDYRSDSGEGVVPFVDGRRIGAIRIGDNVFVGANCVILPGTSIGNNVLVAAGSVARGQLQEGHIYGGVPCSKLKPLAD